MGEIVPVTWRMFKGLAVVCGEAMKVAGVSCSRSSAHCASTETQV